MYFCLVFSLFVVARLVQVCVSILSRRHQQDFGYVFCMFLCCEMWLVLPNTAIVCVVEKEMVLGLLPLILDADRAPHLQYFLEFLQQCSETRITLDQWESFLQFNIKIKVDLSDFEDDGACKFMQ
jgi:hypothetical protein